MRGTLTGAEVLAESNYQISTSFQRVSLTDPALPAFVALSYVWGDLNDTLPLSVSEGTVQVTRNLHEILECLSSANFTDLLWIDALCINQNDLSERAAQVALMGEIYSRASYVLAFLSPLSGPYHLGLSFLEQAAADAELHYEPSLSPHNAVDGLNASSGLLRDSLIAFFAAPWWTRVWTVQEFVLAKRVVFKCGDRELDAGIVRQAFDNLASHERKCCWAARRAADGNARGFLDYPSEANGGLTVFAATLRINNLNTFVKTEVFGALDFLGAISLFRTRQCTDPRDRVFGLSGFYKEQQDAMPADYTLSTATIYQNLAMAVIERSQTLDVLSHVLHGPSFQRRTTGLPSWVPDWDATMDDAYHLIYGERIDLMRHFTASGDTKPVWNLGPSGSITARGVRISKISSTAPGYPSPSSKTNGKELLDTWRRLANLPPTPASPNGESAESKREWAFQTALCGNLALSQWAGDSCNYSSAYETWQAWFTHQEPASLPTEARENAREFDFLVQTASLGRRFFVTEDGRMGFGPEVAEKGDDIVILSGGKVPYVLREGDEAYEVIGDAFLDGAMVADKDADWEGQFEDMVIV
ncbi:hypothetical protein ACJZ2D_010687 [Fusarium nematophilum]